MARLVFLAKPEFSHSHQEIELLYVQDGFVTVEVEGTRYELKKDDVIVVNSFQQHSILSTKNFLIASISIELPHLQDQMQRDMPFFACNSALVQADYDQTKYDRLHGAIENYLKYAYQSREEEAFLAESYYYLMLYLLTKDFAKTDLSEESLQQQKQQRTENIEKYLKQNFNKQISLNDLADKFYLSPAYLSRYFRKEFGTNFLDYLNQLRLKHATEEILRTDKPITQIAMNAGFSNITAFNKMFREEYSKTPSEYRKENQEQLESNQNKKEPMQRVELYDSFNKDSMLIEEVVYIGEVRSNPVRRNWNNTINIGTFAQMTKYNVQNHVLYLRNGLHFRFVRLWGLYDKELGLWDEESESLNFNMIYGVLDFLVTNHIRPHIELGKKGRKIVGANLARIYASEQYSSFDRPEKLKWFLHEVIVHLVNRYGQEEIDSWCFEYWSEELDEAKGRWKELSEAEKEGLVQKYLEKYDIVSKTLREVCPNIQLGGCGFPISMEEQTLKTLLKKWEKHEKPDFFSVSIYPYYTGAQSAEDDEKIISGRFITSSFFYRMLKRTKELLKDSPLADSKLYVTEWNLSIVSNNIIHDSCLKGAYIMHNLIDNIDNGDMNAYWGGTDLFLYHSGMNRFLNGAAGLLTNHGIRKPAWYAFDFMNSLGKNLLRKSENVAVTEDGHGNYSIVCHNYTHLNHSYYMVEEGKLQIDAIQDVALNTKRLKLYFVLPADSKCRYRIRSYSVNNEHGSVLSIWTQMGEPEELNKEDFEYLKGLCVPQLTISDVEPTDGKIHFEVMLEQNEIVLLQIGRRLV